MKRLLLSATLSLLAIAPTNAAIVVPGANGTDGALNITQDTVIDLSKATTGTWDQDNSANSGNGVYDPEKWAVVFKYTSVNVLAGKKLTFKNHATRAPVVWLVSGNVTVAGTVDLSGESATESEPAFHPVFQPLAGQLTEPGPGGFRGGGGWRGGDLWNSAGFGPGGGNSTSSVYGGSAGYGGAGKDSQPNTGGDAYGNPSLLPLVGGSGGAGALLWGSYGMVGGAGGGAILIAAAGNVNLMSGSSLLALGGNSNQDGRGGNNGAGSGGGIRIVCTELIGAGNLNAAGGNGVCSGAVGRIRLERATTTANLTITPAPSTVDLTDGIPALLWPPSGAPKAKILSINAASVPSDPKAAFGAYTPDVSLPSVSTVVVLIETINVEQASRVVVRGTPQNGATVGNVPVHTAPRVNATIKQVISENPLKIHWEATVPTLPGYSAIQARIVRP